MLDKGILDQGEGELRIAILDQTKDFGYNLNKEADMAEDVVVAVHGIIVDEK